MLLSEVTLVLEKCYSTKHFYNSNYVPCMAGYYVGIIHHFLAGCLEYC